MRVAFLGDTTHPNAVNWIQDLVGTFGLELTCVDFEIPDLGVSGPAQVRIPGRSWGKLGFFRAIPALRRQLRVLDPDVVVAYRVTSYGFLAAAAGARPLVIAGQGQNIVSSESPPGSRACARYALRRADLLLAWAPHMAEAMVRLGADRGRILVSNRGVRTDRFTPPGEARHGRRVVTSRQLAPYYRTHEVVEAVARLVERGEDVELWICGDGPDRERIETLIRERGLTERARLFGRVGHDVLADVYRQCDVYASMVPTDGVSSSLLEAMSSGLVPVVVDNEPNRLWVDAPARGRLVRPGDANALAEGISGALELVRRNPAVARLNRDDVVRKADRRTNLAAIVDRWRGLVRSERPA